MYVLGPAVIHTHTLYKQIQHTINPMPVQLHELPDHTLALDLRLFMIEEVLFFLFPVCKRLRDAVAAAPRDRWRPRTPAFELATRDAAASAAGGRVGGGTSRFCIRLHFGPPRAPRTSLQRCCSYARTAWRPSTRGGAGPEAGPRCVFG
jgi:hypothetical protein